MAKPKKHGKKWRIRWSDAQGRRQSEVFARYRDAERALSRNLAEVEQVELGLKLPIVPDKTFNDVDKIWVQTRKGVKRAWKDEESILRCHLRPFFGGMLLRYIDNPTAQEFIGLQVTEKALDKKTVANHLTILIAMLNFAVEKRWLATSPRIKKPKVHVLQTDFRFLRNDEEIERFLTAALGEGEHVQAFYLMAISTGMRAGELAGLRWANIDFDRSLITVDRSFDGPTKSERVRHVPLLTRLRLPLQRWRLAHPGRLVFTNAAGNMYGPSSAVFQEVLHRVLKKAEFPKAQRRGKLRRYITFHDLRHTFASHWMMKGGDIFKLQKILGHASMEMTMRYAHLAPDAFADDLDRFGIAQTGNGEVIELAAPQKASAIFAGSQQGIGPKRLLRR